MALSLDKISKSYAKCSTEKLQSPSYVQMFTKNNNDVILALIKNKQSTIESSRKGNSDDRDIADELELTGSPLKLDLSLHTILDETLPSDEPQLWSKEEALHIPLSSDQAREIANIYNKSLREDNENDNLPIWVLCTPTDDQKTLLITAQSDKDNFTRGIVTYEDTVLYDDIDVEAFVENFAKQQRLNKDLVAVQVDCKYVLSGMSYHAARTTAELLNAPQGSSTELHCQWTAKTVHTPIITCNVTFEQEVIIGHLLSPCHSIWRSICGLHSINQLLVDMTVAGFSSVNLETAFIRRDVIGSKRPNNSKRVSQLLNEVETYAYMAQYPSGGCICVTEDTTSLKQCLDALDCDGASNDFSYKLWDILKDCETAEELITLLIQALKFISSGKIRPFIDANNKTYLAKLIVKLSRGHSQTAKVLKNLRSNPPQVLSLVAQVGVEKTMWEFTHIMSMIEHSFFVAGIWTSDNRSQDTIEQINQTIQDMTINGDYSLNPFETLSHATEHSIRLDSESFYEDDPNELTVDEFASLKKHGLANERKAANEVPLIADEIDISPWKNLLTKFAQVHVVLEHLYRAELCLRADFANLKPLASRLLELFVSERSPVKAVGQLINDPLQKITMPIANNIVKDHLKKPVYWYRIELNRKENASNMGMKRDLTMVYVFSQQPVFPPSVWQFIEPPNEEIAEITVATEELKYHCTKYTHISNRLVNKVIL